MSTEWARVTTIVCCICLAWYLFVEPILISCSATNNWYEQFLSQPQWNNLRCAMAMFWMNMFWVGVWWLCSTPMLPDMMATLSEVHVGIDSVIYTFWVPVLLGIGILFSLLAGTLYMQGGIFFTFEFRHFTCFQGENDPTPFFSRILPCVLLSLQDCLHLPKQIFTILVLVVYSLCMIIGQVGLWMGMFTVIAYAGVNTYILFFDPAMLGIGAVPDTHSTAAQQAATAAAQDDLYNQYMQKDILLLFLSLAGMWFTGTFFVWAGNCSPLPEWCFKPRHSNSEELELEGWVTDSATGMSLVRPSWGMAFRRHGKPSSSVPTPSSAVSVSESEISGASPWTTTRDPSGPVVPSSHRHNVVWPCGCYHCGCCLPSPCVAREPYPLLRSMTALACLVCMMYSCIRAFMHSWQKYRCMHANVVQKKDIRQYYY